MAAAETLIQLFIAFAKIGFTSFGGTSMIPLIMDEMSSHGWMTDADLTNLIAIAEMTPGSLGVNAATFAGTKTAGMPGGVFAVLGVLSPTLTLTLLVNEESSFKVSAAQEIAMYLNTARLTVTVEAVPWDTFLTRLESGDFDLYYGECRLTADWDLTDLLSTSGANNYGRFSDADFAALLTAERTATGDGHTDASAKLYEAFCRQTPIAPICFARSSILTTSGAIEGLTPSLTDPFYNLQDWTIHFS